MTTEDMAAAWIEREIKVAKLLESRSCFLLEPRQTGKTSLIRRLLPEVRFYDLLDSATYPARSHRPA